MTSLLIPYATNPLLPDPVEIVMAIVFVIILTVIIAKFVVPQFEATYAERTAAIQGGMEKAEKAQAEAEAALKTYQAQLAEARSEAAKIREEAKTQGTQIIAELREQAQAEASRIRQAAEAQLEAERTQVLTQLRSEIGGLATTLAGRIVGESLDRRRAGSSHRRPVPGRSGVRLRASHPGVGPDGRRRWSDRRRRSFSTRLLGRDRADRRAGRHDLFAVVDALDGSATLRRVLTDPGTPEDARAAFARGLLGGKVSDAAVSSGRDRGSATLVRRADASPPPLERQAVRAELVRADRAGHLDETEDELFRFARLVESDSALRNALSERSIDRSFRENLVGELLEGRASLATIVLAKRAVAARERSFGHTLEGYINLAAAQKNRVIATVRVARPLTEEQLQRLRAGSVATGRTRESRCRSSSSRTCWAGSGSSSAPRSSRGRCPAAWPRPTSLFALTSTARGTGKPAEPTQHSTTPDDTTHH